MRAMNVDQNERAPLRVLNGAQGAYLRPQSHLKFPARKPRMTTPDSTIVVAEGTFEEHVRRNKSIISKGYS